LLVLDRQPARLLAYQLDGTYDASTTAQWDAVAGMISAPLSIAVGGGQLYIADGDSGKVLVFGVDGGFLGIVRRPDAPVAGLGLDCHGLLVVHPGSGGPVQLAGAAPSYATCGTFLAGPFEGDAVATEWQRVQVTLDALPAGAHLQLYCWASDKNVPPAPAPCSSSTPSAAIDPATKTSGASLDRWRAAPRDASDVLALTGSSRFLWLAGVLQGDSTVTPTIRQIRLEYNVPGWLQYLPAIYRNNEVARVFLDRALALFRSFLDDEYGIVRTLPRLFDAGAAPDVAARPTALDWLASWFAIDLDERWTDAVRRAAVADGFRRDAWRGTRHSLRQMVALYAGVTPWIEEPGTGGAPWSLGNESVLGVDTMLTSESPDGAVLDDTAIVDHSALVDAGRYGAPVFAGVANRFTVQVYAAELPTDGVSAALDRVRSVLDREKPAHTTYDLCVIDARMRVGDQARLGIDTIVGGPPRAEPFDGTLELGADTVLADESPRRRRMSVMGQDARVGVRSTLA
jgi:phage tail-like protein